MLAGAPRHVLIFRNAVQRIYASMSWHHVGHVAEMRTILNDLNGLEEKGDDGEQRRESESGCSTNHLSSASMPQSLAGVQCNRSACLLLRALSL